MTNLPEDIPGKSAREQAAFILGAVVGAMACLILFCAPVLLAVALGLYQPVDAIAAVMR